MNSVAFSQLGLSNCRKQIGTSRDKCTLMFLRCLSVSEELCTKVIRGNLWLWYNYITHYKGKDNLQTFLETNQAALCSLLLKVDLLLSHSVSHPPLPLLKTCLLPSHSVSCPPLSLLKMCLFPSHSVSRPPLPLLKTYLLRSHSVSHPPVPIPIQERSIILGMGSVSIIQ